MLDIQHLINCRAPVTGELDFIAANFSIPLLSPTVLPATAAGFKTRQEVWTTPSMPASATFLDQVVLFGVPFGRYVLRLMIDWSPSWLFLVMKL